MHVGGRAILNSANLEDGELPGSRMDRVFSLAREYGAAVICLLIDERGQARDVEWKMEVAHRIAPDRSRALRPRQQRPDLRRADLPALHRRRRSAQGRDGDDGGDPPDQGRDPRRLHDARRSATSASASSRPPGTRSTACSCTSACRPGSTRRSCTPSKIMPINRIPEEQRQVCARPHLRPPQRRLRPAAEAARGVRRRAGRVRRQGGPQRLAGAAAPAPADHRRRPRGPHRRARRGARGRCRRARRSSTTSSSTACARSASCSAAARCSCRSCSSRRRR